MKLAHAVLLSSALALSPIVAEADPVPVGTGPSGDLIINFDYTSPPVPLPGFIVSVFYGLSFGPPPFSGNLVIDVFGGLNGDDFRQSFSVVIEVVDEAGSVDVRRAILAEVQGYMPVVLRVAA